MGVEIARKRGYSWAGEGFFKEDFFVADGEEPVYADKHLVVTRTDEPLGLRFAGEIDTTNSNAVADSLRATFADAGDRHIDLTSLSFCDISGIRALVQTAAELGDGRRLLLHGLPAQLQTVMRVTGWSSLPSLVLCDCGDKVH
jgi:anti-anti-sigma factor